MTHVLIGLLGSKFSTLAFEERAKQATTAIMLKANDACQSQNAKRIAKRQSAQPQGKAHSRPKRRLPINSNSLPKAQFLSFDRLQLAYCYLEFTLSVTQMVQGHNKRLEYTSNPAKFHCRCYRNLRGSLGREVKFYC